jgi:hypothetical protein
VTASQQPTGHDKAVEIVARVIDDVQGENDGWQLWDEEAAAILVALRAALAAGDADVAEALGLNPRVLYGKDGQFEWWQTKAHWTEATR